MQEEVESRTVTLAISTTRMTANVLKSAISKYLAYRKEKKVKKAPLLFLILIKLLVKIMNLAAIHLTKRNSTIL